MCDLVKRARILQFSGLIGLLSSLAGIASAASVDFNREVRPILTDNCF